jgi:DNA-binding transcriptional ArsR family regulator
MVDLGDGVNIPAEITDTLDHDGYEVEIHAVFDRAAGRYLSRRVTVTAKDLPEVTGEGLRTVPVATLLREAVMNVLVDTPLAGRRPPSDLVSTASTAELLEWVSLIYRRAVVLGDAPAQSVANALGMPRSTAGRWITRARDRGLLTVVDKRGRVEG